MFDSKLSITVLIIGLFTPRIFTQDCERFLGCYDNARTLVSLRGLHERMLQMNGFVLSDDDIGFEESGVISFLNPNDSRKADVFTTTAMLIADKNGTDLSSFGDYAICLNRSDAPLLAHSKYRSIDGYGNNLKHPYWGATSTPFGRFAPKRYDDGIHSIRKSVTGSELPSPRKIVQDVLLKAQKTPKTKNVPNASIDLLVLYVTHDMAQQVPVEAQNNRNSIRCCGSGNKQVLPPALSHSSCLPVSIAQNDPFYKDGNVTCLNMVRSQMASAPCCVQHGEILNKATSFIDHSIIYGTEESETNKIRTFSNGKLRMGPKNILPVDSARKYLESSSRLTGVPIGAIWPVIFARSHNNFAEGLSAVNPSWNDEKLFQEARRINIGLLQYLLFSGTFIERVFGKIVNETYSENFDPSTTLEFTTAAYRFLHYFVPSNMMLISNNSQVQNIPLSETIERIDLVENAFDDSLRGILTQPANFGQYSDELYNKFGKNEKGFGLDLLSIDIQRGRDHGLPTFLDVRRKCDLNASFETFDDMLSIFPQSFVDMLKETYDHVEDIDLIVGGALETFNTINTSILGATFGCIVGEQYRHVMGGDAYFYAHNNGPYPFTTGQLTAIGAYNFSHLLCQNSEIDFTQKVWYILESEFNTKIYCKDLPPMNLSAWANV